MRYLFLSICLLVSTALLGKSHKPKPSLRIQKAEGRIKIDGILDEADWDKAQIAGDFFQSYPADTSFAVTKTEARVTYDDNYLYVSAVCYDKVEGDYVVQSLKRDFTYSVSDAFSVYIDPFNDKLNGFCFAVNPFGTQREGSIQNGGTFGVTIAWDNLWYSSVKHYKDKWIVEMAIPFKTIRYKEGLSTWGINFSRNDLKQNENSSWSPVPRAYDISVLSQTGNLIWEQPPKKAGSNVSLIPYATANGSENYQVTENEKQDWGWNVGGDAKIAVNSSLNLDLTINPDFSQVDVDRQVTNLSRFSLFFPEQREFFIENSDLFANFGFTKIRPFFSRKIGLHQGQTVPIIAGARLSGKINRNWRIGLMNMQTARDTSLDIEAQNYSVAAFQRQVFTRSNIAGIFVNRQGFKKSDLTKSDFNRIVGLDYNLASSDSKWQGKFFYHHSFNDSVNGMANATWLMYNTNKIQAHWNHEYVDKNYNADIGFVPRGSVYNPEIKATQKLTYWRLEPSIAYKFYPLSTLINWHGPGIYYDHYMNADLKTTDRLINPFYKMKLENTAYFEFNYSEYFTKLLFDTDVTFSEKAPLPKGDYRYRDVELIALSNKRKKLNGRISALYGTYFNGTRLNYTLELNLRTQPWGIFSLVAERTEIRDLEPTSAAYITLVGPKAELSFTKSLFFTVFTQYNTQIDNLNINARFQWRFRPMSDLFIVYTDNYNQILAVKNRALVVKLRWWINL